MKKILILLIILCTLTTTAQGELECDSLFSCFSYYESGEVKFKGTADCQERAHGKFVEFRKSGEILGVGEFSHGVRVGVWITYSTLEKSSYVIYFDKHGNKIRAEKLVGDLIVEAKEYK